MSRKVNDYEHAHSLLDGNAGMAFKYGAICCYEDADIEKWCPDRAITKTLGMRIFWDMQQNQEMHKDIALFHHLMIEKR